jgi:hypothetical protein
MTSGVTVTLSSVSTLPFQNTCIAGRGEFGTQLIHLLLLDIPRISEVGLYDTNGT